MHRPSLAAAAALVVSALVPIARGQSIAVVVEADVTAPDGNGVLDRFRNPVLNDAGRVAFAARLAGTAGGGDDDQGLYLAGGGGSVARFLREGQIAPDGNGTLRVDDFGFDGDFALNDAGQVAYFGRFAGTDAGADDDRALLLGDGSGTADILVRAGRLAPGGEGVIGLDLDSDRLDDDLFADRPSLNDAGQVAFRTDLRGVPGAPGTPAQGVYVADVGGLREVARTGDPVPQGTGEFTIFGPARVNDAGQTAFFGRSVEPPFSFPDIDGYRADPDGALTRVVADGDPVAGGREVALRFEPEFAFNDRGQLALKTNSRDAGATTSTSGAVFVAGDDGTRLLAQAGTAIPGGGTLAAAHYNSLAFNDVGAVAFPAIVGAFTPGFDNDVALLLAPPGGGPDDLAVLARRGAAAPDGNGVFDFIGNPSINDAGQVLFRATLEDTAGGFADREAIYLWDGAAGLMTVARAGGPLLGSTITNLDVAVGPDLSLSGLNDRGQVAFAYSLADGRAGVAVFTIPEPAAAGTLAVGGLSLLRRRRH